MIILDTNVVSALMQAVVDPPIVQWLDRQPRASIWITSVTVLEIQREILGMPLGKKQSKLTLEFDRLLAERLDRRIANFDTLAAKEAASLIASRGKAGKSYDLEDGMIAGIAIAHLATIATRNVKHFDDLPVAVIDPWRE